MLVVINLFFAKVFLLGISQFALLRNKNQRGTNMYLEINFAQTEYMNIYIMYSLQKL